MPTLTLSWTDLALMALTAGLIGGIVLVGRTSSQAGSMNGKSHQKKGAAQSKKKKKAKALPSSGPPPPPSASSAVVDPHHHHHHPPTPSPPSLSVPAQPETAPEPTPAEPPPSATPSLPVQAQSLAAKKKKGAAKKAAQSISHEEFPPLNAAKDEQHQANQTHKPKRPFAERHQPPVRKTIVDDMIDPDVQNPLKMARVMNIVGPEPEDSLSPASDAEDGWEKVPDSKRSRATGITISIGSTSAAAPSGKPKPTSSTSEQALSKRQRQNARKKEAAKALKLAQEADRLSHLSAHKREQERLRMNAQTARSPHPTNATSPKPSGKKVASASIAEDGRLIWE